MTIRKDLEHKKLEKATSKMIKEMVKARQHLQEKVHKVLDEDLKKKALDELEDYKRRRALQLEEIEVICFYFPMHSVLVVTI